jgi:proteasome component ECM29
MEDLLVQAGSSLWRSRESSCLALADVLQGRRFDEVSYNIYSSELL